MWELSKNDKSMLHKHKSYFSVHSGYFLSTNTVL